MLLIEKLGKIEQWDDEQYEMYSVAAVDAVLLLMQQMGIEMEDVDEVMEEVDVLEL